MCLLFSLARSMKASMESALMPVPLLRDDFRIVIHISPGMSCVWMGVGAVGLLSIGGIGSEYRLLTTSMLWRSMVAIVLVALIRFSAVL